jgi:anti-anti-sigma regulatory factor
MAGEEFPLPTGPAPPWHLPPARRPGEAHHRQGVPMMPHSPLPLLHARKAEDVTLATILTSDLSEAKAEAVSQELLRLTEGVARPRLRLNLASVRFLTSTALGLMVGWHKRVRPGGGELMRLHVTDPRDRPEVSCMSREELIAELLELNQGSTFQFTAPWLRRQWTHRLRSLLAAVRQQHQAEGHRPSGVRPAV